MSIRPLALALMISATAFAAPAIAAAKAPAAAARAYTIAPDMHSQTEASFTSKASIVKFVGRTPKVNGETRLSIDNVANAAGTVNVDLASLDTGITMRNEHMRGYLETDKFPNATFTFTGIQLTGNKLKPNTQHTGIAKGTMTIHGVTRPISAPIELTYLPQSDAKYRAGDWVHFTSQFKVKLSEYQITLPAPVLGVKVADDVVIDVEGMAKAQ